jgi:hypothetical protein
MSKTYWEKLKDPRWQKKRLEIMERDKFTCQHCSSSEKTLNVHHKFYKKRAEPWDYEDWQLITLCEDCHGTLEGDIKTTASFMADCNYRRNLIMQYLHAHDDAGTDPNPVGGAISMAAMSFSEFLGEIIAVKEDPKITDSRTVHRTLHEVFGRLTRDCALALEGVGQMVIKAHSGE